MWFACPRLLVKQTGPYLRMKWNKCLISWEIYTSSMMKEFWTNLYFFNDERVLKTWHFKIHYLRLAISHKMLSFHHSKTKQKSCRNTSKFSTISCFLKICFNFKKKVSTFLLIYTEYFNFEVFIYKVLHSLMKLIKKLKRKKNPFKF